MFSWIFADVLAPALSSLLMYSSVNTVMLIVMAVAEHTPAHVKLKILFQNPLSLTVSESDSVSLTDTDSVTVNSEGKLKSSFNSIEERA